MVRHNRQRDLALPWGQIRAAEGPVRRAVLEVAEETGLSISNPEHMARYAGSVAAHEIFLAQAEGEPVPNRKEIQDTIW